MNNASGQATGLQWSRREPHQCSGARSALHVLRAPTSDRVLHVLFVGTTEAREAVLDALPSMTKVRFLAAMCPSDVTVLFRSEKVDIAILHDSLSLQELRGCAADIRRRWPRARILLIRWRPDIDDPLYDERVSPGSPGSELTAAIERLAQ